MHLIELGTSQHFCRAGEVQEMGMHMNHLQSLESSRSLEKLVQSFLVSVSSATQHDLCWTRCYLEGLCDLTQMLWKCLEQGIKSRGGKA